MLCAPATPTEADDITIEHVERVLELLTQSFKYVVIDTASGLDENTLPSLEYATDLLLISATDIPSIRSHAEGDRSAPRASASHSTAGTSCSTGPTPAPA